MLSQLSKLGRTLRQSRRQLRLLTFNTHEAYSYELAKTGHQFDILLPPTRILWRPEWDERIRPLPSNMRVIGSAAEVDLGDVSGYDLIIAQTLDQFRLVEFLPTPKLLLLHTPFAFESRWPSREAALQAVNLRRRLREVPVIYVSLYCQNSWSLPGRVIRHGVDERDYAGYRWRGEIPAVLTVSHYFRERGEFTGYELHQRVIGGDIPSRVIGYNPGLPDSGPTASWDELRRCYQRYGVYLNTTRSGASMAMFEAATAGMPIVTTPRIVGANEFTDGYDAYVSAEPERLRACVMRLLRDKPLARKMGERGRRTVARIWGIKRFIEEWQEVLDTAVRTPGPRLLTLSMPLETDYFRCDIRVEQPPGALRSGELAWLQVRVRNMGTGTWLAHTNEHVGEVRLGYRWLTQNNVIADSRGVRTPLPSDLPPREEVPITAMVRAPASPGHYVLRLDLVCRRVGWFSKRDGSTADIRVTVE